MKIAQVTQHYLPVIGGQEVYIELLNRVFREAGWSTEVFQPNRGVRREDVITLPRIRGLGKLIRGSEPYVFNLLLRLLAGRPLAAADCIIAHYAFHAAPLRKFARKTIILSHGIEWHLENQTWDDKIHERRARAMLGEFFHVVNDTHYLRHFGHAVEPASGYFTEVSPGKWFIPNCVDTEKFSRNAGIPELKQRKVIFVPRQVTEDRGIRLAIHAFRHLRDRHPDVTMLVAGRLHQPYASNCITLAKELGLGECVEFREPIPHDRIVDFYSSAVMTLIPTLRREGTSLSAIESMACGTPTVSTNAAGLRDLPTIQCDPEQHALAAAMETALRDGPEIGARQMQVARETFNLPNWAAAWKKVVHAVTSR